MPRPVHFEIHAADPDRAVAFYETVLGWKFERWGDLPYWLITTGEGPGIDGGGTVALAKHAVPTVGWLAYCKDTDGNLFGLMQSDPTAA